MVVDADIPKTAPDTPDAAAARRARQLAILDDLAEAGREIALALKGRIVETAAPEPDPASAAEYADLTRAFDRASRATRMAIALSRKLEKDEPLPGEAPPTPPRETRAERAGRVRRIMRRVTRLAFKDGLALDALDRHVSERLFDPDITGELQGRPIGAIVAEICDHFGLPPCWTDFAGEAWARAEIAERPEGSPYAAWPDLPPEPPPPEGFGPWDPAFWEPDEDLEDDDPGDDDDPEDPGGDDP
jgi:hypothetical protein